MREIIANRLKKLRELLGFTQAELAKEIGVSKEFISMIEAGKRLPSLEILSKLSSLFKKDISYFLAEKEEEPFLALFRSDVLDKEEIRKLTRAEKIASDYAFLEEITNQFFGRPPTYPDPPSPKFSILCRYAEKLAEEERRRLGLGIEPIKDIFSLVEPQGLHVIRQSFKANLDGLFLFSEERGAFAIINASRIKGRQVFTAAHEYCHYLKDRDKGYLIDRDVFEGGRDNAKRSPIELIANIFASSFLIPREAIENLKGEFHHIGAEEALYLKRYFGVSYQAMVWRLKNLGIIKDGQREKLLEVKPQKLEELIFGETEEKEEEETFPFPERYLKLALDAYFLKKISLGKLAELIGVDSVTLRDVLAESGLMTRGALVDKGSR